MPNPLPVFGYGTAAPTETDKLYQVGTVILNIAPSASGIFGWICSAEGRPGTWLAIDALQRSLATITAAGTLTAANRYHVVSGAGNQTLASAAAVPAGTEHVIVSNNVLITLVAAASQTLIGNSTVAANTAIRIVSNGSNTWFRSN